MFGVVVKFIMKVFRCSYRVVNHLLAKLEIRPVVLRKDYEISLATNQPVFIISETQNDRKSHGEIIS